MLDLFRFCLHSGLGRPDMALLVMRATVGSFFAISGLHKLFVPEYHKSIADTMVALHIPFPRFNAWWVPGVEFFGGAALMLGLLTVPAALGLFVICIVACTTDGPRRVREMEAGTRGLHDASEVLDDILYLPEVLYGVILLTFVLAGGGRYSLDHMLLSYLT
jgi:putative oxidoreductase